MQPIRRFINKLPFLKLFAALYRIKLLQFLIPIAVIGLVYFEGRQEFKRIDWGSALFTLHHMHPVTILLLLLFSLFSVAIMSSYDLLIRKHFGFAISNWTAFRYGWIANTSNNLIGFAGLTGAGIRTILYRNRNIPISGIGSAVAFLSTITFTGLSLLAWLSIVGIFPIQEMVSEHPWLIYAVWAIALYLPLFLLMQRTSLFAKWFNRDKGQLGWTMTTASIGASFLEWLGAGMTFWIIGAAFFPELSFTHALGIYTVAAIAGIISMAPGGIGGFDLTALLGLQLLGYPPDKSALILVLYRILYYVVPWLIGLAMAAFELPSDRKRDAQSDGSLVERVLNLWQKVWRWPGQFGFVGEIGAWSLGKLVLASGIILLLSAATPGMLSRMHAAEELLTLPIMRLSHQLSVIIGIMLIVLSRGISLRIKRAYYLTLLLLCTGALFTLAKAFDYEEAIILLIVALLLWISRHRFYRVAVPFGGYTVIRWGFITAIITYGYYLIGSHTHPAFLKHLPKGVKADWLLQPNAHLIASLFGLVIAWLLLTLLYIFRPKPLVIDGASAEEQLKLRAFLEGEQGNLLTHVLFTGDKSFFWAMNDSVLIPYAKIRNKLVVLGDPIGPKELMSQAIQQFQQYSDQYALEVVFYQASPDYLPLYHENGYRFFKLGEEALVPLEHFTLIGKKNTSLRNVKNRFEREGYLFDIVEPPHSQELIDQLHLISKHWLDGKQEKGFSLGWFDEPYLQLAPIAILRNPDNDVIAFASMAPGYDGRTISIDLMRYLADTPNGTMDQLFIQLLEWAQEQGYARFNLGMAPLSSVGQQVKAMREEKLARMLFQHGGSFYGFSGLRRYKEKFNPVWEPRYLAYPASSSLPILLLELVRLIARKPGKKR